jgi:prophage maintenance system killer protein
MHGKLAFSRFVFITAAAQDVSADEAEARIDREKVEAAFEAAFGGADDVVLYPDLFEGATRCCFELIRHRPLRCDNKRVAYDCMLDRLRQSHWAPLDPDSKDIEVKLDAVGDGTIDLEAFFAWVRFELGKAQVREYERRRQAFTA